MNFNLLKKLIFGSALIYLLTSCASGYNAINPRRLNYQSKSTKNNIEFSYRYHVLYERGNKKYAKKESRKGVKVVAVKIVNNSDSLFKLGRDLHIHLNGKAIKVLEPQLVYTQLRQNVPVYLLYLLLTPMQIYTGNSSIPIGLALGPGLTAGNMISAGSANKSFLINLKANSLNGRVIYPGDTVYGLIGIYDVGYNPLTLE